MSKTIAWAEGTFVNMTEPFTVMLTNEAQQFATDSNRKVTSAQSYYTDIIVIRGSQERTDYTIGNITSGSGITVSKNSKRVTFSVSAGATIGADTGVIEIPITLDGQTVKKQFSWSCGKQGPQGIQALQPTRNWTGTFTTIGGIATTTIHDFNRTPVVGDVFTNLDGSSNTGTWQVISVSGSNVNIKLLSYVNSKGDNAKNLSITPSSQYFKSTDGGKTFAPNTITIKPTLQGEISFGKWQYSIDGGVSFADVVSGQKGLTISNNVLSVSKDSSLYSDAVTMITFRAVANDSSFYDTCSIAKLYDVTDIGDGRNLIQKSQLNPLDGAELNLDDYTKNGTVVFNNKSENSGFSFDSYNNYQPNSKYVLSYYFTKTSGTMDHFGGFHNGKGIIYTSYMVDDKPYDAGSYAGASTRIGAILNDGKRHRIIVCYTTPATIPVDTNVNYTYIQPGRGNTNPNFGVKIEELKLEKGSSPTGWSPAPEDVQTAILSTKSEISSVSSKVDQNTKSIENRVEKTTYQNDLKLVKGDINKANEGLNKWRYEIYPKSLFTSEYQGKSTMDVFAKNTNLTPSQSVLINDTNFGKSWAYGDNYIGYALTFVKFSAAKSVAITFKHDDGAHLYLNGKLVGGDDTCNTGSGHNLSLSFVQGWNCLEVVLNEKSGGEYIGFGTTISAISECQLMNCYYGTPVARQSHITNQLVQNTTDIEGISGSVQKVMSTVGGSGKIDEFVNNYSTWKKKVDGIETRVGETYTTKDDFNGLEIGGRNLVRLGGLSSNGATSFSYDKTTDTYTIVSPVVSTVWGVGVAVRYDDNHKVLIPYGKTYILSFEVKVPQALSINIDINNYAVSGNSWAGNDNDAGSTRGQSSYSIPANTWTKVWVRWANTNAKNTNKVDLYDFSGIGLVTKDCTSAVTWQIRHVKGELGNKPTDWTPAPEDVNGKIVNVETIANQTAKKFEWIVKGGDSSSNFTLTDRVADLVAERINLNGLVTFSGLNTDAKNEIGKVAQSKVDGLEIGGRNLLVQRNITQGYLSTDGKGSFIGTGGGDQTSDWIDVSGNKYITITLYEDFTNTNNSGRYCEYDADKNCINTVDYNPRSKSSIIIELKTNTKYIRVTAIECKTRRYKIETGNKATDWTPAPEDVSQDATNKASQALTDAKNYSSSAVNWVTTNGLSTTNLNSMVKKWTDGAVSDTTQINGGWIKANTITASKIAIGDFTNYCQLDKDSASYYGFTATDDKDGIWYTADPIKRDKEISQWFTCEDSQKLYVEYDISTTVQGKVNSSDTDNSYLHSGIMIFAADGNKKVISYIRTKDATAAADGIVTHISVTETLPTGARFFKVFLQTNGQNGSFSGVLKIRNLQVRKATTGKLIVDGAITADKINVSDLFAKNIVASGTIQSENYAESNGSATAGSKWILSDGSFKSKNLSWDASGNITAAGGKIGKYTITDSYLTTGSGGTCTGIGGNQAFWAGSQSSNEAPFRVSYGGQLVASGATLTNAIVSGDITATKGQIGGWNITSSGLFTNDPIIFEEEQDDGTTEKVFDERFNAKVLYNSSTSSNTFMFDKFCNTFVDTSNVQYDDSDTLYTATSAYSTLIDQGCIDIHESMYCPDVSENHDWNYNYHLILTGNRIEFNEYTLDGMYKYMPDEGLTSIGVSDITTGSFKCDQIQVGGENVTSIIGRSDWIDCDYGNGISNYENNTWNQVQVRKVNGIVFLRGVMQNSTTWQTHDSIFTFPKEYAPEKESRFVMQGSGSNRWLLVVRTSGICKAERYSNNTTTNNTVPLKSWLNVYASWPAR